MPYVPRTVEPHIIGLAKCQALQDIGVSLAGTVMLADAVAASSCFPPLFLPIRITVTTKDGKQEIPLTDGGVYDNLGAFACACAMFGAEDTRRSQSGNRGNRACVESR